MPWGACGGKRGGVGDNGAVRRNRICGWTQNPLGGAACSGLLDSAVPVPCVPGSLRLCFFLYLPPLSFQKGSKRFTKTHTCDPHDDLLSLFLLHATLRTLRQAALLYETECQRSPTMANSKNGTANGSSQSACTCTTLVLAPQCRRTRQPSQHEEFQRSPQLG